MHTSALLSLLFSANYIQLTQSLPIIVTPGNINHVPITHANTFNATHEGPVYSVNIPVPANTISPNSAISHWSPGSGGHLNGASPILPPAYAGAPAPASLTPPQISVAGAASVNPELAAISSEISILLSLASEISPTHASAASSAVASAAGTSNPTSAASAAPSTLPTSGVVPSTQTSAASTAASTSLSITTTQASAASGQVSVSSAASLSTASAGTASTPLAATTGATLGSGVPNAAAAAAASDSANVTISASASSAQPVALTTSTTSFLSASAAAASPSTLASAATTSGTTSSIVAQSSAIAAAVTASTSSQNITTSSVALSAAAAASDITPSSYGYSATPTTTAAANSPPSSSSVSSAPSPVGSALSINVVNKMNKENMKMYLSGLDGNGALIMLAQDGSWYYPSASGPTPQEIPSTVELSLQPNNSTYDIITPGYVRSARLWVAEGGLKFYTVSTPNGPGLVQPAAVNPNDPNAAVNYAFIEFDWEEKSGLYADITQVDFVGLPLGIELLDTSGNKNSALGMAADAAPRLCNMLKEKSSAWGDLCVYESNGNLIRVLAPSNLVSQDANALSGVFESYVNQVWAHYTNNDLIINTQTTPGNVTCRVSNDQLNCAGDNRPYARPTSADIFGCNSGPFAIEAGDNGVHLAVVPRLCAAFNRATLLQPGGQQQPGPAQSTYYTSSPNNWYSAFVHELEADGRGYAFAYDDVALEWDDGTAGLLATKEPQLLTVFVGGV